MREIVLDTETTGFDPADGHKIVEIGCVEIVNHVPTGKVYHQYINPEREIDAGAVAVHGITNEKVKDEPTFGEIVGDFLDFVGDARLVIHNAEFDIKFLNAEMKPYGFPPFKVADAVDTVLVARKKYPGQPANLDALCRRFGVDLSDRGFHGALLDAQLLAKVYLELNGGRQHGLGLDAQNTAATNIFSGGPVEAIKRSYREPRAFAPSEDELARHDKMLDSIKDNLWKN